VADAMIEAPFSLSNIHGHAGTAERIALMRYVFAECVLDTALATLHRAGRAIPLRPKVFHLLQYLLEQRAYLVAKDVLCTQVWPGQCISDTALEGCIKLARQAIGDSGRAQRLIQTRRGYGYRFIGAVEEQAVGCTEQISTAPGDALAPPAVSSHELAPGREALVSPGRESGDSLGGAGKPAARQFAADAVAGERKLVTLLGCTLVHSPTLGDQQGLDALHSQMRALYTLARGEVEQYGGRLLHITGDRFMALFGVPVAQEDHAQRAVLAALGLLHRVAAYQANPAASPGDTLVVRLGLYTGLVAVGGIGDEVEAATAVVGDTAILTTALQEHAAPGTILCSDTTARLVQAVVDMEAVGSLPGGGQPAPVVIYKVLGRLLQRSPVAPHKVQPWSRFVGRSRELMTLLTLLTQVEDGHGHVVGIMGDPGMGKSRLLTEFRQRLTGRQLTYLRGRCLSYGSAIPYLPVLDLLRQRCGITDVDRPEVMTAKVHRCLQEVGMAPEEWAPYLEHLLGLEPGAETLARLSPQAIKARAFEALVQLHGRSSRRCLLVLEVEDLHWIDATSEEWLTALVERLAGVPMLILASYRPGYRTRWLDKSYATQLTLRPLTPNDSRQVLQVVFSTTPVAEPLTQTILARAEGNPFFLEELARTVVEHGAQCLSLTVPNTIHAVLAARIDRLSPAPKGLLQAASVIGQEVRLPLLQALVGLSDEALQHGLQALQAAEFVYETRLLPAPTYAFKHVLTQEVAYQSLLHSTRAQYHRQIAQLLEERWPELAATQPELLAQHYTEAGLGEQAIPCWLRAGQRASECSAHLEAISHLTKGLNLLKTLPDTPEHAQQELTIYITLGPALRFTRGPAALEVAAAYQRARALCQQVGETSQLFPVLIGLVEFYINQGECQTAQELAEHMLRLAQQGQDPVGLGTAHITMGNALSFLGELDSARRHLEQGLAPYRTGLHGFPGLIKLRQGGVFGLSRLAQILWKLGYPDQAMQRSQEALTLAQALSHPFSLTTALVFAAELHCRRREGQMTYEQAEAALVLSGEQGFAFRLAQATILRGRALVERGQEEVGIAQIRQGLAAERAGGLATAASLDLLAEALSKVGRIEEGLKILAADNTTGQGKWVAEMDRLQGELLLRQTVPEVAQAEACFQQALARARRQQAKSWELRAAVSLSRLWQQQGKRAEAYRLLAPVYGWFTEGFDTADLRDAQALLAVLEKGQP